MTTAQEQNDTPPSIEEVERSLAAKRKELADAERSAVAAEAAMDADAVVRETQRAEVLRKFIARLEVQLTEAREAHGRTEAAARLLGIRRAHGSLVASLDGDETRVRAAVATLADAITKMNARYHQLAVLRMEAGALVDRFGLDAPELPRVMPPALRSIEVTPPVALADYARPRPALERCEHKLRERRTYEEVRGTDGYAIIAAVGRTPWPPLTDRQQRVVAHRAREAAETHREMARTAAEVGVMHAALDSMPATSVANLL